MSYINFDKSQLVNLEYSLNRELLRANRAGSYANSTIINCNTRKYHGMLITPQPGIDHENHVLLSSLDETIIQMESDFNLGIHKFPGGKYNPKGHKYLRDFVTEPYPKMTYRVGGVILTKEMVFTSKDDRMIIKYTLVEAHSPTKLRFTPFLAFRNIHSLSKENIFVDKKYEKVANGIKVRMYQGYTDLFLQFSNDVEYTHVPDWYYNIEYQEEMNRGYDYQEDLYVPGFFELEIKMGESIYFAAGTQELAPVSMKRTFNAELEKRIPRDSFIHCLINSAQQFIVKKGKTTEIMAGFPWFGRSGRSTFVSLPGLTLVTGDIQTCKSVIDTMVSEMNGPLFPLFGSGSSAIYGAADTSLWFFWTLQQYADFTGEHHKIWKEYGKKMKLILESYRKGMDFNIHMEPDGLIYAGVHGMALTWMDAFSNGKPVTPRMGKAVEINALWYNAIRFSLEVAALACDQKFIEEWEPLADIIPDSFFKAFWNPEKHYLADYIDGEYKDWAVRPNMVIATSLPYSPVKEEIRKEILSRVKQELLTPRGLRTLTPKSPVYKGIYQGNQNEREAAYHQGSVSPWLLGHFVEGYLRIHGKSGISLVKTIYTEFEPVMTEHGIGTISEIYDGDPPHQGRGAISQSSSVAELLRIGYLIKKFE
ncbi:MAG: amylo-alpha-1,6-glucosidase [Bacteroidota bacterium]